MAAPAHGPAAGLQGQPGRSLPWCRPAPFMQPLHARRTAMLLPPLLQLRLAMAACPQASPAPCKLQIRLGAYQMDTGQYQERYGKWVLPHPRYRVGR